MKKGLTLVELVIALALIAIISAILLPNFFSTTDKARLKSDIQSAKVIQNALELYRSEHGEEIYGIEDIMDEALENLITEGYLKNGNLAIQTVGAEWVIDNGKGVVVVNLGTISAVGNKTNAVAAYNQLTEPEKYYVSGVN